MSSQGGEVAAGPPTTTDPGPASPEPGPAPTGSSPVANEAKTTTAAATSPTSKAPARRSMTGKLLAPLAPLLAGAGVGGGKRKAGGGPQTEHLIFEPRPGNLPQKSAAEEKRQRREYERIMEKARQKEVKELQLKDKKLAEQRKRDKRVGSAQAEWLDSIIPNWDTKRHTKRVTELWWKGIPSSVRGRVWALALGNTLSVGHADFEAARARAQELLAQESDEEQERHEDSEGNRAHTVRLIALDISRTFPDLCMFQRDGPYYSTIHSLLGAVACFQPDVGYVQGMSFLAGVLLLNMEAPEAFVCLTNMLTRPCLRSYMSVDLDTMSKYGKAFDELLAETDPALHSHLSAAGLTADIYLTEWIVTVYSRPLSLDTATRIWDLYFSFGESFLFRTALGILKELRAQLLAQPFEDMMLLLKRLPPFDTEKLVSTIASVHLTEERFIKALQTKRL